MFCKEVVLRLEAMCQHEDKKPELASGEETTHFQTSTPNNTLEEFQPEGGMGEELQPEGVGKAEDVTPSPVCPADLNILTSSSLASESECYQIPLQARTLRDLTSSLFYPPPPPPSPGVAMGTGATPITPPAAQSPRQSTFVIEPAKDVETASGSTSDSDQTIVNEEPLVPNGIPTEGVDEAATPDQAPPPASVHADEPPSYPLDQQAGVQPLSVPPVQAPSVPPVQPAVVQSQPIVVTQQVLCTMSEQLELANQTCFCLCPEYRLSQPANSGSCRDGWLVWWWVGLGVEQPEGYSGCKVPGAVHSAAGDKLLQPRPFHLRSTSIYWGHCGKC